MAITQSAVRANLIATLMNSAGTEPNVEPGSFRLSNHLTPDRLRASAFKVIISAHRILRLRWWSEVAQSAPRVCQCLRSCPQNGATVGYPLQEASIFVQLGEVGHIHVSRRSVATLSNQQGSISAPATRGILSQMPSLSVRRSAAFLRDVAGTPNSPSGGLMCSMALSCPVFLWRHLYATPYELKMWKIGFI